MIKFVAVLCVVLMLFSINPSKATVDEQEKCEAMIVKSSGGVIYSHNENERRDVSGLTRLMPALVISELIDSGGLSLDEKITVSTEASKIKGATAFVEGGEEITAEALYKSAVIISAGDALYALGEHVFKGSDLFTAKINERLNELNIDVKYTNPMGDGTALSANELAIIGDALIKTKSYGKYCTVYMDEITHEKGNRTQLVNPNRLIRSLNGCTGLATGSSDGAGYCGVFTVDRTGSKMLCVILGAKNSDERFKTATELIERAYSEFDIKQLATEGEVMIEGMTITGSIKSEVDLVAADDVSVMIKRGSKVELEEQLPDTIQAPIKQGETVGVIICKDESGKEIAKIPLTVIETVDKADFGEWFWYVVREFFVG